MKSDFFSTYFKVYLGATLMLSVLLPLESFGAANSEPYDTARIYHAMAKARLGEPITIGVIGGSITNGHAASTTANRWANLVAAWWEITFPESTVTLINAGIGGTGSDIGAHRIQKDLLQHNPDFIVVEFSVNDSEVADPAEMMEGVIQQALLTDSLPGVLMLLLKQQDGSTEQAAHKPVGDRYKVPMISFADLIDAAAADDGYTLADVYLDGVHPVDLGMAYIAEFITDELNIIYGNLPDDENLPEIDTVLPAPLVGKVYSHCFMYTPANIVPSSNSGWKVNASNWDGENPGDEITFTVDGNAISIMFSRHNNIDWGQVEAWVDDGPHKTIDAYWDQTWGPAVRFEHIAEGLSDGEHTLHIKVKSENSGGGTGHFFRVLNVLKAGNFEGTAPIARAGINAKALIDTHVVLDGSESFDPAGLDLVTHNWTIVSQPVGSICTIDDASAVTTGFTPDLIGTYKIGLIVNNGLYNSVVNVKTVHAVASNTAPVADAGDAMTIGTGVYLRLNGMGSSDTDDDSLSYNWYLISEPVENSLRLYDFTTPQPRILALNEGEYVMGLVVNDSIADSGEATVTLTAIEGYTALEEYKTENAQFSIFPNPASEEITLTYILRSPENIAISIFNTVGELQFSNPPSIKFAGQHADTIDLRSHELQQGLYILRVKSDDSVFSFKFFKN
jgi:lysophospholipase L1-like esterase